MIVELSAEAEADIKEIYEFIGLDSTTFATIVTDELLSACERIGQFPYSGIKSPNQDNPNVREAYYRQYRIAYLIRDNSMFVLAIEHTARDRDN